MMLLVDSGNTRIKWALVRGRDWLHSGSLPVEKAGELSRHLTVSCDELDSGLHVIEHIWVSNVAGDEIAFLISNFGADWNAKTHFIVSVEEQCGVRNGYSQASQLGSDRWAALVGAWHLTSEECLVVNCGTATTIDSLSGQGEFMGGLILPGVEMMLNSLSDTTAQLMTGRGGYALFPKNTADAMFSGVIQASCGAIQRQHALLDHDKAKVLLSGGAAEVLQEHLRQVTDGTASHSSSQANGARQVAGYGEAGRLREEVQRGHFRTREQRPTVSWPHRQMPLRIVDNLVLQGLHIIAREASAE